MISFENLYVFLYVLMAIVTLFFIRNKASKNTNILFVVIFTLFWLLLFGLRDFDIGSDTNTYLYSFNDFLYNKSNYNISDFKDIGYLLFMLIVSKFSSSETFFIFIFDSLILIPLIIALTIFNSKKVFFLFFIFCSFFFFKSIGINIMRQGVSISFFILGLVLFLKSKKKYALISFLVAFLFHASIILPIFLLFISNKIKSNKLPLIVYCGAIVLALFNFDFNFLLSKIPFLSFLFQERFEVYINLNNIDYQTGFRLNFVIFNSIFVIIGYYLMKRKVEVYFTFYKIIFNMYLLLSANFFLMFSLPYSDRAGLLSWILMPFLLVPFLNKKYINHSSLKLYVFCLFIFAFFYNL